MGKMVVYPSICDNDMKKMAYIQRAQEVLRLKHNAMGALYRNKKITKQQWEDFVKNYFDPRSDAVVQEILKLRHNFRAAKTFSVDLDNDFVDI